MNNLSSSGLARLTGGLYIVEQKNPRSHDELRLHKATAVLLQPAEDSEEIQLRINDNQRNNTIAEPGGQQATQPHIHTVPQLLR